MRSCASRPVTSRRVLHVTLGRRGLALPPDSKCERHRSKADFVAISQDRRRNELAAHAGAVLAVEILQRDTIAVDRDPGMLP